MQCFSKVCATGKEYRPNEPENKPVDVSAENGLLEVHRGTLDPDDYERRKIQYELFETYREIALLKDSEFTGSNDKLLTYVRNVKSVHNESDNLSHTAFSSLRTQVKHVQVRLAQNMAELKLKKEQISELTHQIRTLEADAQANYKQKTKAIRELNSMNNQYMLAISQCQVDLIDLRATARQLAVKLTKATMKASVKQDVKEAKLKQVAAQTFTVPDSDDDEDEIAELSEEISILEKQITKLKTSNSGEFDQMLKLMQSKLDEDERENMNEEEIANILKQLQGLTGPSSDGINIKVEASVRIKLEKELTEIDEQIYQLEEQIKTRQSQIAETEQNYEAEVVEIQNWQKKLDELIEKYNNFSPDSIYKK